MSRYRLLALIVGMAFLFGNNFVALEIGLRSAGPLTLQTIAMAVAVPSAFLVTRVDSSSSQSGKGTLRAASLVGLALTVVSPVLIVLGVQRVNPALVAILLAGTPITTMILDGVILDRRLPSFRELMGLVVGIAGVALVVIPLSSGEASEMTGVILLLVANVTWSIGLSLTRRLKGVAGNGRFVTMQLAVGLPVLFVLAVAVEGFDFEWTWGLLGAVAYSGLLSKGVGAVLQFRAVRGASPFYSSLSSFLVPAVALLSTWTLLGESILAEQIAGGVLIGSAVSLVLYAAPSDRMPRLSESLG